MSNLPPGVTEAMIPGCGSDDWFELTLEDDYPLDVCGPDEWTCEADGCGVRVGFVMEPCPRHDHEVDAWVEVWLRPDERRVCRECAEAAWAVEAAADAEFEAAMAKWEDVS